MKVIDLTHTITENTPVYPGTKPPTLEPISDLKLVRHNKLFKETDIVNIENLCNLEQCGRELFRFSCFPLKIGDSDGAPIRAVAWFE